MQFSLHLKVRQLFLSVGFSIFLIFCISLLYHFDFFRRADHLLYDHYFRWRGPVEPPGNVVLVLMDDKSAIELDRMHGRWSRSQTAMALHNLCRAGAEIIGLDMVMTARDSNPEEDRRLSDAIRKCNNVVLARISATPTTDGRKSLKIFREGMIGEGFIDAPLDSDNVWRRLNYFNARPLSDGSLEIIPAFALEVARTYLYLDYTVKERGDDYFILGGNGSEKHILLPKPEMLINFFGNYSVFESISYADVVHNRFDPASVRGKIVLIGSSLAMNKDKFLTPFSNYKNTDNFLEKKFKKIIKKGIDEKEPGVSCHAHAAECILSQQFIQPVESTWIFIFIFILGVAGGIFYLPNMAALWQYIILLCCIAGVLTISYFLFLYRMLFIEAVPLFSVVTVQFVSGTVLQKGFARKKAALIKSLFGKYVSSKVVEELVKGDMDVSFTGRNEKLTILFSDLRGFTGISETLNSKEISRLLNRYFDTMIPIVFQYNGTLDKLIGDAVMVFFGAPLKLSGHPVLAAQCALAMLEALENLRQGSEITGVSRLKVGIGINTGEVTVGNLGSLEFLDYTVIGDPVNVASRLEGLNKIYGTSIIVSEFTKSMLDERFLLRDLDVVKVKGKQDSIKIYELYGYSNRADKNVLFMLGLFQDGIDSFRNGDLEDSKHFFKKVLRMFPDDGPSLYYLKRIASN